MNGAAIPNFLFFFFLLVIEIAAAFVLLRRAPKMRMYILIATGVTVPIALFVSFSIKGSFEVHLIMSLVTLPFAGVVVLTTAPLFYWLAKLYRTRIR